MAFCQMHFFSDGLLKQVGLDVILPDKQVCGGRGPFATYYLLHGLSDDHTIWHRRTRIEWYVRDLPLIVVMPDGFRGFYTNNNEGPAYANFFARELPDFIERIFPAKKSREGRCIGGLSMGGYGALRIALGFPDRFISANSHSGALMAGTSPRTDPEFRRIFSEHPAGTEHDLLTLVDRAARSKTFPKLLVDCGKDDQLIDHNRKFHAALKKQKIAHEYNEFPGGHDWDYWDEHVQEAINFHARALKL